MPQPIHGGQSQPCAISDLSTSTWVLRLRLGPPGAAQPSHCPPLPSLRQQNGSHSLLIQGTFVALSQSSSCKGPSVSLSFMDKRVHPGCACVGYLSPGEEWLQAAPGIKSLDPTCLVGKWWGEKEAVALGLRSDACRIQRFWAGCQLQLAGEEGLFPDFDPAVLEGSWGHSFYSQ